MLLFVFGWNTVSHARGGNFNISFWSSAFFFILYFGYGVHLIGQLRKNR